MMNQLFRMCGVPALLSAVLAAAPVGNYNIAGTSDVQVSSAAIDFGTGIFLTTSSTDSFLVIAPGTLGTVTNLDLTTAVPGPVLGTPVDPFLAVPAAGPRFTFSLAQIPLGAVTGTPYSLTQNPTGVSLGFSVLGVVTDLLDAS